MAIKIKEMNKDRRKKKVNVFMKFAEEISKLSTCDRLSVGCVVTDNKFERVFSVGYNGNAAGEPNKCDTDEPGNCGCTHAEANALIKCGSIEKRKIMFVTTFPCKSCAKLIINSGFEFLYYHKKYRIDDGAYDILVNQNVTIYQQ